MKTWMGALVAAGAMAAAGCGPAGRDCGPGPFEFAPPFAAGMDFRAQNVLMSRDDPRGALKAGWGADGTRETRFIAFGRASAGPGPRTRALDLDLFGGLMARRGADLLDRASYVRQPPRGKILLHPGRNADYANDVTWMDSSDWKVPATGKQLDMTPDLLPLLSHLAVLPAGPCRVGQEWPGRLPVALLVPRDVEYETARAPTCRLVKVEAVDGRRVATIRYAGGQEAKESPPHPDRAVMYEGSVEYDIDSGMLVSHACRTQVRTRLNTWGCDFQVEVAYSPTPAGKERVAPGTQVRKTMDPAAEKARALCLRGHEAREGRVIPQDLAKAVEFYRQGAQAGSAEAAWNLGVMYEKGTGTARDERAALGCFEQAARGGHAEGMAALGRMHMLGRGVRRDFAQAMSWSRKAAASGCGEGALNVALMHRNGWGVRADAKEAVKWLYRGAETGSAEAACELAGAYETGQGVGVDFEAAAKWYRQGARDEHVPAMEPLAKMCEEGRGTEQNLEEAAFWYHKAAQAGRPGAMYSYAFLQEMKQSKAARAEAIEWYGKAAAVGDERGKRALERLGADKDKGKPAGPDINREVVNSLYGVRLPTSRPAWPR